MPRQTKHASQPIPAQIGQKDIEALPPLSPIPDGFVGYSGTQGAEKSAKIIDIKKPNRLHSLVLENEKKEFVGYLTARFGVDPEVAIQAYEQLSSNFNREASTRPPEIAPELYAGRERKSEKGVEFLNRVYGPWIGPNATLFQPVLRKLDKGLMQRLSIEFLHRTDELAKLLPPKMREVDARLGAEATGMTKAERKVALDRQRLHISG